jgi:hypothetical protein
VALLAGCAQGPGPVSVALPPAASSTSCQALGPLWPATVSGKTSRTISVDSPAARAWGEPAIIAICGYPALEPTTLDCIGVDDVDWVVQPLTDGVRFTAYGRSPTLDVLVPATYAPQPLLLPAFGAAAKALPANGRHCS